MLAFIVLVVAADTPERPLLWLRTDLGGERDLVDSGCSAVQCNASSVGELWGSHSQV